MNRWKEIGSNADTKLWEAPLPSGNGTIIVPSSEQPPDWLIEHHFKHYGDNPPKTELGERGYRFLFPGETTWREYGFNDSEMADALFPKKT